MLEDNDSNNKFIEKRIEYIIEDKSEYEEVLREAEAAIELYKTLRFEPTQKNILDTYLDIIMENISIYTKCAFKAGFDDCMELLKGLKII